MLSSWVLPVCSDRLRISKGRKLRQGEFALPSKGTVCGSTIDSQQWNGEREECTALTRSFTSLYLSNSVRANSRISCLVEEGGIPYRLLALVDAISWNEN